MESWRTLFEIKGYYINQIAKVFFFFYIYLHAHKIYKFL